jgi:hypothetical protein
MALNPDHLYPHPGVYDRTITRSCTPEFSMHEDSSFRYEV